MAFSVNTNIASLQAQNYLRTSSDFQSKTINRVTSGLRIVQSGDDAAGLAIANGLRSDQSVLTQGIRNGNDGLSTLQTIDGGMNNISKLLDRARTLATQSATDTFEGNRSVLNTEFKSVIDEIDRQAQAIGLDSNGKFAKSLSVFMGGGRANATTAISNGSVSLDLSSSTVDSRSLGLKGLQATGKTGVDIGTGAGDTTVSKILANSTNTNSEKVAGYTSFYFTGSGFSDTTGSNRVEVSVNLSGVTDTATLASAINSAIEAAGNGTSQQATAFKNAGIQASVVTDADGKQQLAFSSSTNSFQVMAGDRVANAFLGNFETTSSALGTSAAAATASSGTVVAAAATAVATVTLRVIKGGTTTDYTVNLDNATDTSEALIRDKVNVGLAGSGLTASLDGGNHLIFTADDAQAGNSFEVQVAGDDNNDLGLGSWSAFGATSATGAGATFAAGNQNFEISVNGGATIALGSIASGASQAVAITNLNNAIQADATLRASGVVARNNAGQIQIVSLKGDNIRVNAYGGATVTFGFTAAGAAAASGSYQTAYAGATAPTVLAGGSSATSVLGFTGIRGAGVSQTVTLSATDSNGEAHALSFSLSSANSATLDDALTYINSQILTSNDSTLQKVVAVKERTGGTGTAEGIRFASSLAGFNVSLGTTSTGNADATHTVGLYDSSKAAGSQQGGTIIEASTFGTGSTAAIDTASGAKSAVTALSEAVSSLGISQAAVGKGQNRLSYAIELAQSQLTNQAAAESRIRDADLAQEAANLSKAQILVQAGTAALAQANSAPQAILTLLRG